MLKTLSLFALTLLFSSAWSQSFYSLPKHHIIKDSCVAEIIVRQFELDPSFDNTTERSFCTMEYTFGNCPDQ